MAFDKMILFDLFQLGLIFKTFRLRIYTSGGEAAGLCHVDRRSDLTLQNDQPCFGCREFPAQFRWCEEPPPCPEELKGPRDLGWMLYDMDYTNPEDIRPLFFRASLEDGVLRVPGRNSREVRG